MKKTLSESKYSALVDEIGPLYEGVQRSVVEAYWKIGRRIVEVEQKGDSSRFFLSKNSLQM